MASEPTKNRVNKPLLWIIDLGIKGYQFTRDLQLSLVAARRKNCIPDILLLVEHNPVFTMGRHGHWENLLITKNVLQDKGIPCIPIERGGDITFHGPGQLIGYPILKVAGKGRKVKTLVNNLEATLIQTLAQSGIDGKRNLRNPGVWVDEAKIGAIGLAIKHGISFHGFALNVDVDLAPFSWIHPCGLKHTPVISMKNLKSKNIEMHKIKERLIFSFSQCLGYRYTLIKQKHLNNLDL